MSDICSILRKNTCIGVVHIFETAQVCFPFVTDKKGVKTLKIYDIHKVLVKIFYIFFAS